MVIKMLASTSGLSAVKWQKSETRSARLRKTMLQREWNAWRAEQGQINLKRKMERSPNGDK